MLDPFSQPEEFRRMMTSKTLEQERQQNQAAALRYVHEMRPDWCAPRVDGVVWCGGCGKMTAGRK